MLSTEWNPAASQQCGLCWPQWSRGWAVTIPIAYSPKCPANLRLLLSPAPAPAHYRWLLMVCPSAAAVPSSGLAHPHGLSDCSQSHKGLDPLLQRGTWLKAVSASELPVAWAPPSALFSCPDCSAGR